MYNKSVAVAAILITSAANGAGFYLKEQSVVSQGAAFAGAGARQDSASSIYFNPAGIAEMDAQLEGGLHLLKPNQRVTGTAAIGSLTTATQEPLDKIVIPNIYYTKPLTGGVLGFGVSVPFGSTSEYDSNFIGALDSYYTSLKTIDYSLAYARSLNEQIRLGVSLVYQTADIEQSKLVSLAGSGSTATLKGDSDALGATFGLQFDMQNGGVFGLSYKLPIDQDIEGSNTISNNFTLSGVNVSAGTYASSGTLHLPSILSASLVFPVSDRTDLLFDVTHYGWSAYDNVTIATQWGGSLGTQSSVSQQNYKDTTSLSVGAEHDYGSGLKLRAGIQYDPTPTNDTDRSFPTPDADRTWLAVGASKETKSGLIWDLAFTQIRLDKTSLNRQVSTGVFATADAKSTFNILSLGIRIPF